MKSKRRVTLPGSEDPIASRSRLVGKLHPHEQVTATLILRYKPDAGELDSLEQMVDTPPGQQQRLPRKEFIRLFGADPADVEKVRAFAAAHDLKVADVHKARRAVCLEGTAQAMGAAFGVKLGLYRQGDGDSGVVFRGHRGRVDIPDELAGIVLGVLGLSNPVIRRRQIQHYGKSPLSGPSPFPQEDSPYFTPPQVARLYNFPTDATGKGQTIGIIQSGGTYKPDCLREYFENYLKTPMPKITSVPVGTCSDRPGDNFIYDGEVCLDIQIIGSIAPDAHIVVYYAPDETLFGLYQALQYAIHDEEHECSVISFSWGHQEAANTAVYMGLINQLLQKAAELKITVCTASGDAGSSDTLPTDKPDGQAHVDFPASSPWILACGGTRLEADDHKSKIEKEVVWNDGEFGATGGGVSAFFSCPPYQQRAGICPKSVNPGGKTGRGVPDVAGNASSETGYIVKINENPLVNLAGTSSVAPLWAALIALLNEKLNTRLGFVNPLLYQIAASEGAFNQITQGNNQNVDSVPGYSAGPGWNACTGLGTPNGQKLFEAIRKRLKNT
jgi:kumamolisin